MAEQAPSKRIAQLMLATANNIERSQVKHIEAGAMFAKDAMNRGITAAGYGPGSSFRNGRTRFRGARYSVRGRTNPVALVSYSPAGPAALWERGSKSHTIVSKKVGGSAVSRGQMQLGPGMFTGSRKFIAAKSGKHRTTRVKSGGAIRTPAGFRAYVRHPGQRKRPFWRRVDTQVRAEVPAVIMGSMVGQLAQVGWKKGHATR